MTAQPTYQQSDFLDLLTGSASSKQNEMLFPEGTQKQITTRKTLTPSQQRGFRNEYNQAMITLYVFGCLFKTEAEKKYAPEELLHDVQKAKKTQARYERYMPKASQKIVVHYGRDVVDAYIYQNHEFMRSLRGQAENSAFQDKWHMFIFAKNTVDKMVKVIQRHNAREG